jgi:hypothetical protein
MLAAESGCKLKVHGSNEHAPGSPEKKRPATGGNEDDEILIVDESAPAWAQHMQKMMIKMMGVVDSTAGEARETRSIAQAARDDAAEAKIIAEKIGQEVEAMKKDIIDLRSTSTKPTMLKVESQSRGLHTAAVDTKREEEKKRTITFGDFPEDTKSEYIVSALSQKLAALRADLDTDGIFAYGRKFATRGGARFKTEAAMWSYLRDKGTERKFDIDGHTIYMNRDFRNSAEDEHRVKSVRKLVRAIIEHHGGDGTSTKTAIDTDYKRGIVWFKDARVGEYANGKMILKGSGSEVEERFTALMG